MTDNKTNLTMATTRSTAAEALKVRFKAGTIPLQSDFADLIDMADKGAQFSVPQGGIIMWSGNTAPQGWALCDGTSGTPNLMDRFILGGKGSDIGLKNSTTLSGSGGDKNYTVSTSGESVEVTGDTDGTALTYDQLAEHSHDTGVYIEGGADPAKFDGSWGDDTIHDAVESETRVTPTRTTLTGPAGRGKPHSHHISITSGNHSHTVDPIPPYYILAFIIKL